MTDTPAAPPAHEFDHVSRAVPADQLLSAREVADHLGISVATVTRRVRAGLLIPVRTDPLLFDGRDLLTLRPVEDGGGGL